MSCPRWYVVCIGMWIAAALLLEGYVVFSALSHLLSTVIGGGT